MPSHVSNLEVYAERFRKPSRIDTYHADAFAVICWVPSSYKIHHFKKNTAHMKFVLKINSTATGSMSAVLLADIRFDWICCEVLVTAATDSAYLDLWNFSVNLDSLRGSSNALESTQNVRRHFGQVPKYFVDRGG